MPLDLSPLLRRGPDPASQGLQNLGGLFEAMMERKRRQQEFDAEQEAKRQELAFRQGQEQRLTKRQEMLDERDNTREDRRDQRAATTAIVGAKPQDRAFVAQAYGGSVAPAKPNYLANPEDPLGPNIDFLENVEADESSPLGFKYNVNPEHERRTQEAANTQIVTLPGGQQMSLPAGEAKAAHFAKLRAVIGSLPEGPDKAMRMRSLQEAEALELGNEETGNYLRQNAALFGQDQRAAASIAARPKRGAGGGTQKPGAIADDARSDINAYLSNQGYKADVASMRQFQRMEAAASEALKGNSAAARVFMGMFVKFAQGESGVLNESDMDTFWNQAGSPKDRSEEALAKLVSGGLGEAKQRAAAGAIQALMNTAKARREEVYQGASDYMQKYGPEGERHLKAYFGKGFKAKPEDKAKALSSEADDLLKGIR